MRSTESVFTIPLLRATLWSQEPLPGAPFADVIDAATGPPELGFVDALLRRRLSPLGRGMLHCAGKAAAGLGPLPSVFASQHGEPARTLPILADLAQQQDTSPTQFSMNVHNAVAGIWSIARQDRSASTSLAAGPSTFAWGLVEALQVHRATGGPVLYVYGDDRLPELLAPFAPPQAPLHALALLLGTPAASQLHVTWDGEAETPQSEAPQSLHFLQAMAGGGAPWTGPGGSWTWRLDPP